MISTRKQNSGNGGLHIGDHVTFAFGLKMLRGVILEDRGRVGIGGQQLFLVEAPLKHDEPLRFELPEDELELESGGPS